MSRLGPDPRFSALASAILLASASGLAALWPLSHQAARAQSGRLIQAGDQARGLEAADDYHLAALLNPASQTAFARLASAQITTGHPELALISLAHAGQGSAVEQLKVRTLIELGRNTEAAAEAPILSAPGRPDNDLVLAALALATAGRASEASSLGARVASPQAAGRIARVTGSHITLAAELYATGLQVSSSTILTRLAPSYERNLLLARLRYTQSTPASLSEATDLLRTAIAANPAALEARELLVRVYQAQGDTAAATAAQVQIGQLQAGKL